MPNNPTPAPPADLGERCREMADHRWTQPGIGITEARSLLREAADELDRLKARLAAVEQAHRELVAAVVRPWTRDDGAELWKVNLAWFDTTTTEADALEMVQGIASAAYRDRTGLHTEPKGA